MCEMYMRTLFGGGGGGEGRMKGHKHNKSCYQQRCASSQQKLYPTLPKRYEREAEFWPKGRELKWPLPLLAQPIALSMLSRQCLDAKECDAVRQGLTTLFCQQ